MAQSAPNKKLLVEGVDDKFVIVYLMDANGVSWTDDTENPVVHIEPTNGFTEMAKAGLIETELKASGLQVLGIIADADDDAENRWTQLRNRCLPICPTLPDELPSDGIVADTTIGPRMRYCQLLCSERSF